MNQKSLVVLVVLLVAAIAAVLALRDGNESGPTLPVTAASATPGTSAAHAAPVQANAAGGAAAADLAADPQRTAAPVVDASKTAGDGATIRGRVVDKNNAARGGVELLLNTWPALDGFDGVEFDALPAPGRRELAGKDRPKITTRADGTFTFAIGKDRAGILELESADLVFANGSPHVSGKKGDQDLGDLVALKSGVLQGVVQDAQARPVADVKVAVTADLMGLGTTSSSTTKSDGTFSLGKLRPGKWTLRTASGKFLPAVQQIELAAEEQRTGVVLVVQPGNAIAGQVVDDRGVGVANMKVGSKRKEKHGAVDIERFTPDEATTTDANGYFTLSGLSEETATVRAFGPGHSPGVAADVAVGTGDLVLRVERYGVVEGVLQGLDGTPIAGSRVSVQAAGEFGDGVLMVDGMDDVPGGRARSATTGADGSFRLDSVKPGAVTLVARGPTHQPSGPVGVDVRPAQTTKGVMLRADLGAIARVKVVDEAGKPVADAQVRAKRAVERGPGGGGRFQARAVAIEDRGDGPMLMNGDRLASAKTDEQGIAVLQGLPAGNLELNATHGDFAPAVATRVTTPKSGTVDAELRLRTPGHAVVTVLGTDGAPQPGVDLQISANDAELEQPARNVTSDEKGEARVGPLAPGGYTASLRRPNQPTRVGDAMMFVGNDQDVIAASKQPFAVVAGETVRVEVRRPVLAKVHGTVTGGDGPVADCVVELLRDDGPNVDVPGFGGRNATTAADGTFAFDDVESGSYRLSFGKQKQVVKAIEDCVVPANTPDVQHDLVLRTGSMRVQVLSEATGEPVENAQVQIDRAAQSGAGAPQRTERRVMMVSLAVNDNGEGAPETSQMTFGAQRAFTDENGVATIEDVPAGQYTLHVTHKKYAPADVKDQVVAERRLTDAGRVSLAGAGQVRGKVVGADGKQARLAMVEHKKVGTEQWGEPTMAMNGTFRLTGLAAGKYVVHARQMGPTQPGEWSPEVEVDVKAGETASADVQLPK